MTSSILIVSDRLPSTGGAGAESVLSALCDLALGTGAQVDFLVIESDLIKVRFDRLPKDLPKQLGIYRAAPPANGVDSLSATDVRLDRPRALHPASYSKSFVFGDRNIIAFSHFGGQKIAWPDDPPYLVSDFKSGCSLLPLRSRARAFMRGRVERLRHRALCKALTTYAEVVHHANHHAAEFHLAVRKPITYAPPLIPSMRQAAPARAAQRVARKGFIHVGHLGGAASLAAVEVLLAQPVKAHFLATQQVLTLVGKADIPERLRQRLLSCGYRLTGFVEDLDEAMRDCRAVLVPGDYAVGARTRILHALSLGTPVIAHTSCLAGMPELRDCRAIQLFSSDAEFVHLLDRLEGLDLAGTDQLSESALRFMAAFAPAVEQKWRALFE